VVTTESEKILFRLLLILTLCYWQHVHNTTRARLTLLFVPVLRLAACAKPKPKYGLSKGPLLTVAGQVATWPLTTRILSSAATV